MANDRNYQQQHEDLRRSLLEMRGAYSKLLMQFRAQKTTTVIVGVSAGALGLTIGYVAAALRAGR